MRNVEIDIRDKDGKKIVDEAECNRLIALHEECCSELKQKLLEMSDKFPKEYQISAMNAMACEIMASALHADINAVNRGKSKGDDAKKEAIETAKSVTDMFGQNVMPLFIELGIEAGVGNIVKVDGDLPDDLASRLKSARDDNQFTVN